MTITPISLQELSDEFIKRRSINLYIGFGDYLSKLPRLQPFMKLSTGEEKWRLPRALTGKTSPLWKKIDGKDYRAH